VGPYSAPADAAREALATAISASLRDVWSFTVHFKSGVLCGGDGLHGSLSGGGGKTRGGTYDGV